MNIGIIFAGGVGSRMHSKERPKQFLTLNGKPIIVHTIKHFQKCDDIDAIVVVCIKDWIEYFNDLVYKYRLTKIRKVIDGGKTGQLSIYNGLLAAEEISNKPDDIVLIHDGVRPLINKELISKNIECVKKHGSCITCSIVKETIIEINDDSSIKNIPDRAHSRVAKAPQSFYLGDILKVHRAALKNNKVDYIDSCTMMREAGYNLHMIDGPYENIKITTPDDFYTMRAILEAKENEQIYGIS